MSSASKVKESIQTISETAKKLKELGDKEKHYYLENGLEIDAGS